MYFDRSLKNYNADDTSNIITMIPLDNVHVQQIEIENKETQHVQT